MSPEQDGRLFSQPILPQNNEEIDDWLTHGYIQEIEAISENSVKESWDSLSKKIAYIRTTDPAGFEEVAQAFYFSYVFHDRLSIDPTDRLRQDGSHYMTHPAAVAGILADYMLDATTIKAALLHDTLEDTEMKPEVTTALFGNAVTRLVEGVSKITGNQTKQENEAQTLKKKYAALLPEQESGDARIVLIKLADRLHNLRTIGSLSQFRQEAIATETVRHFVPLARRLGLTDIQNELEELSYHILDPQNAQYASLLQEQTKQYIEPIKQKTADIYKFALERASITGDVELSYPTFAEYYRSVTEEGIDTSQRGDAAAYHVNIISDSDNTDEQQTIASIIEALDPIIAMYHGTVQFEPESGSVEIKGPDYRVRIYTKNAYKVHNYSIHETYQHGVRGENWDKTEQYTIHHSKLDPLRRTIRQLIKLDNAQQIIDELSDDLSGNLMYVYTPHEELVSLPQGATVADYAALIPKEFLINASRAKVNGAYVPLDYPLTQRDTVEIETTRHWNPDVVNFDMMAKVKRMGTKARIGEALGHLVRFKESFSRANGEIAENAEFRRRLRWTGYTSDSIENGPEKFKSLIETRFSEAKQIAAQQFTRLYNEKRLKGIDVHNPHIHPEQAWEILPTEIKKNYSSVEYFYAYTACQQVPQEHIDAFVDAIHRYEESFLQIWSANFPDRPGIINALTERIGSFNITALRVVNRFLPGGSIQVDVMFDSRGFDPLKRDTLLFNLDRYVEAMKGEANTPFEAGLFYTLISTTDSPLTKEDGVSESTEPETTDS